MAGTAIIVAYVPAGFVIASDGLEHLREEIISDTSQKIYPLTSEDYQFSYGLAGTTRFADGGRTRLDLYKIAGGQLRRNPSLGRIQDAATFVRELVRKLNRHLLGLKLAEYPDNDGQGTICELVLLGYFRQKPILARARFFHRLNVVDLSPQIDAIPVVDKPLWEFLSGSQLIWNLLCNPKDHRLPEYRSLLFERVQGGEILSLTETAEVCSKYIQACSDSRASALDPFCAFVGGQTHIAKVTSQEGFCWLVPPVQAYRGSPGP